MNKNVWTNARAYTLKSYDFASPEILPRVVNRGRHYEHSCGMAQIQMLW